MCGHTVGCSKHDRMNKNARFQQNCIASSDDFLRPLCVLQSGDELLAQEQVQLLEL